MYDKTLILPPESLYKTKIIIFNEKKVDRTRKRITNLDHFYPILNHFCPILDEYIYGSTYISIYV